MFGTENMTVLQEFAGLFSSRMALYHGWLYFSTDEKDEKAATEKFLTACRTLDMYPGDRTSYEFRREEKELFVSGYFLVLPFPGEETFGSACRQCGLNIDNFTRLGREALPPRKAGDVFARYDGRYYRLTKTGADKAASYLEKEQDTGARSMSAEELLLAAVKHTVGNSRTVYGPLKYGEDFQSLYIFRYVLDTHSNISQEGTWAVEDIRDGYYILRNGARIPTMDGIVYNRPTMVGGLNGFAVNLLCVEFHDYDGYGSPEEKAGALFAEHLMKLAESLSKNKNK